MSIEELWVQLQLAGVKYLLLKQIDRTINLGDHNSKAFQAVWIPYDAVYDNLPCYVVKLDAIEQFKPLKIKDCENSVWWWFQYNRFYTNPAQDKTNLDIRLYYKSKLVFNTGPYENIQELIRFNLKFNDAQRYHIKWDTQ